jgi:hypothetical protein
MTPGNVKPESCLKPEAMAHMPPSADAKRQ